MANSRAKGKRGELELVRMLSERGWPCERNLEQSREGGSDIAGLPVSLEIKRHEQIRLTAWWDQTQRQAAIEKKPPVLAYRSNGAPWQFLVGLDIDEFVQHMERGRDEDD